MTVQELYIKLMNTGAKSQHLVISNVFGVVFNRKPQPAEWGFLRKLMRLYGSEIVFWALLNSSNIHDRGNPLVYVSKVCIGMLKREAEQPVSFSRIEETEQLLAELRSYKRPNWEEILAN